MAYKRGRYYYRSKRERWHVRTEYLGTGALALAIAVLDAEERERQGQERAAVTQSKRHNEQLTVKLARKGIW